MKLFKYLFFLILVVLIGLAIYIATLDGTYQVEEQKTVEAPSELLFEEVNDFKNWEKWGFLAEKYPNLITEISDKSSGKGAVFTIITDNFKATVETTGTIYGKSIDQELSLDGTKSTLYWDFEELENGTKISFGIKGEKDFWGKAQQLIREKTPEEHFRPLLKTALQNLTARVEKAMEAYEISVGGVTLHSGGFYMYITTASRNSTAALTSKRKKMIPQVRLYMQQNNIAIDGSPMRVYNNIDEANGTVIISTGLPTSSRVITTPESEVLCGFLPSQKVVKTTLRGNYEHLPEAWRAAKKFISANGYELNKQANPFEVFLTDTEKVKNPAEWVTEIYLPIL